MATCYKHEKQFIKAHTWYSRGIRFIPSMERLSSQREKLKCLAELAKDQEDKVVRKVPSDILPLELLIKVMQFGMAESHYWSDSFVLRCAWVSQSWRKTLSTNVRNCGTRSLSLHAS
jgi:hypothetical protein